MVQLLQSFLQPVKYGSSMLSFIFSSNCKSCVFLLFIFSHPSHCVLQPPTCTISKNNSRKIIIIKKEKHTEGLTSMEVSIQIAILCWGFESVSVPALWLSLAVGIDIIINLVSWIWSLMLSVKLWLSRGPFGMESVRRIIPDRKE